MNNIYISYKNKTKNNLPKNNNSTYVNVKIVEQIDLSKKFEEMMSQESFHSELNYY
jgi:hypothetical protein